MVFENNIISDGAVHCKQYMIKNMAYRQKKDLEILMHVDIFCVPSRR